MKAPLIPLNEDFKWKLLSEILNVFDLKSCRQILTKRGILPLQKSVPAIKIVLLSMFFSCEISYAIRELEEREDLRTFLKISSIPTQKEIYGILSKYEPQQFTAFVFELLKDLYPKSKIRSIIEDVFKLAKKAYSMEDLHRYTRSSVQKYCSLAVLLVGMTVNYGIKERKELQAFSE